MPKVLLIATSFYPDPYVGAVRATQWARQLPDHGWTPIVACRNNGHTVTREELERQIHPEIEIRYLTAGPSAFAVSRAGRFAGAKALLAGALRRYVLAPDPGIVFWHRIGERIVRLVEEVEPDVVITTGPPNSLHAIGLRLKRTFPGLPWLADFRDAFRHSGRYRVGWPERYASWRSLRFEAEVYRSADCITCAIPTQLRWIRKRFPEAADKAALLLNGAPDQLCGLEAASIGDTADTDWIKVVGYSEAEESVTLARAVAELRATGENIGLRFVGKPASVKIRIEQVLGSAVEFTGPVPHDRAVDEIAAARVLVAVLSAQRSRVFGISSKLFEYLAIPVPVMMINPTRQDRSLFSGLAGVTSLRSPSVRDVRDALAAALRARREPLLSRSRMVREKWSRRSQVRHLAELLEELRVRSEPGPQEAGERSAAPFLKAGLPS